MASSSFELDIAIGVSLSDWAPNDSHAGNEELLDELRDRQRGPRLLPHARSSWCGWGKTA